MMVCLTCVMMVCLTRIMMVCLTSMSYFLNVVLWLVEPCGSSVFLTYGVVKIFLDYFVSHLQLEGVFGCQLLSDIELCNSHFIRFGLNHVIQFCGSNAVKL
ncbi:hypothetical protein Hanom_Chr04g00289561 [Helianthus anomalus]